MAKKPEEPKISAEQRLAAMAGRRSAAFDEPSIEIRPGLKLEKGAIYQILLPLERVEPETLYDFCNHILFQDNLVNPEAQALAQKIGYRGYESGFDQSVRDIVRVCFKAGAKGMVFDESDILNKLQPEEIAMMRSGETNIKVYLARIAAMSTETGRAERLAKEASEPPVFTPSPKTGVRFGNPNEKISRELHQAYVNTGIDPDRTQEYYDHLAEAKAKGEAPKPRFVFFKHPDKNGGPG